MMRLSSWFSSLLSPETFLNMFSRPLTRISRATLAIFLTSQLTLAALAATEPSTPLPDRVPPPTDIPIIPDPAIPLPEKVPAPNTAPILLPFHGEPSQVGKITPTPLPGIPLLGQIPSFDNAQQAQSFQLENLGGSPMSYQATDQTIQYQGKIRVITDTKTIVNAQSATLRLNEKLAYLRGPVKIHTPEGVELYADNAIIDGTKKTILAQGNVSLYQKDILQRGPEITYHWDTRELDMPGVRGSAGPLLLESGKFHATQDEKGHAMLEGENAGITTDDTESPSYWLRAKKIRIYPNDRVLFNHLTVYAGETPAFYFPYLAQPLNSDLGYHFQPGTRSNWGPYLLNTYGVMLGGDESHAPWLLAKFRADLMTERGIGLGVNLSDKSAPAGSFREFSAYHLDDTAPNTSRSGIPRLPTQANRSRLTFRDREIFHFEPEADWRIDSTFSYISDPYFLQDFDTVTATTDPAPDNLLYLTRRDDRSLITLLARFRVNDFYRVDERLPELSWDVARAPIFQSPILWEGRSSIGIYNENAAALLRRSLINPLINLPENSPEFRTLATQASRYDLALISLIRELPANSPLRAQILDQLLNPSFSRFRTYQEFSAPFSAKNGRISIIPQAGVGFQAYQNASGIDANYQSLLTYVGTEVSTKFSSDWGNVYQRQLGLNGLMHVFQPYAHWSSVRNTNSQLFPSVDRYTFTTRPPTIALNRLSSADEIRNWDLVRFGTRNRLLTRRDSQTFDWLFLDTYIDAYMHDPEGFDRQFSNLYNDLTWQPLPWMNLNLQIQNPIISDGSGFNEFNTGVNFEPDSQTRISVYHNLLSNHPTLQDSSLLTTSIFHRINDNWGVSASQTWEFDDKTLQLQQYSIHRDLGRWVAALGILQRDNRFERETNVLFTLTLKDFPLLNLPFQVDAGQQ